MYKYIVFIIFILAIASAVYKKRREVYEQFKLRIKIDNPFRARASCSSGGDHRPHPHHKKKWTCGVKGCQEKADGEFSSLYLCKQHCTHFVPPDQKRWTCGVKGCQEKADGKYGSLELCKKHCTHYVPPDHKKGWNCTDTGCVEVVGGLFKTKKECEASCVYVNKRYSCVDHKCKEDAKGTMTLAECQKACQTIIPTHLTYDCVGGQCVVNLKGTGKYNSVNECVAANCKPPIIPTKKGTYDCISGVCKPNAYGTGKYPNLAACQQSEECGKTPPPGSDIPTQQWIDTYIMHPDPTATGKKTYKFVYDQQKQKLCRVDSSGEGTGGGSDIGAQTSCGTVCPYGMKFDGDKQQCVDSCDGKSNCFRGVSYEKTEDLSKPSDLKYILTNYATPSNGILTTNETAFIAYINDIVKNFCVPRKIDIFTLYYSWPIKGNNSTSYAWYSDPSWLYENYIKLCESVGIIGGVNVYPNFKDSPWLSLNKNTWIAIGEQIGKVNTYAKSKGSKGITYLVFDAEACNCGDPSLVRGSLAQGYRSGSGEALPSNFTIMMSGNVNKSFGPKNKNPYSLGLGEVYWNVGELWPCVGNASQYNNYAPVCKVGSGYLAAVNQPDALINYLIESGDKSEVTSGALSESMYNDSNGVQRVVPLLSTEMLYKQTGGEDNGMLCTALAYYGNSAQGIKSIPSTGEKICGTFDGFSYWSWTQYEQFMLKFAKKFKLKYVGIYDAMFIPRKWMSNGNFNKTYTAALPPTWPLDCLKEENKCKQLCLDTASVSCQHDSECNAYCPKIGGVCTIKKGDTKGACHFNPVVDCSQKDSKGNLVNKCNPQCYLYADVSCKSDTDCDEYCPTQGVTGKCSGGKCNFPKPPDCTLPANKCTNYCGPRASIECTSNTDCLEYCKDSKTGASDFPGSYCKKANKPGDPRFCHINPKVWVDCSLKDKYGNLVNKCNHQCYNKAVVKCSSSADCNKYCGDSGVTGECNSGVCKFNPPPDCSKVQDKCSNYYCALNTPIKCTSDNDCCNKEFKGSYCKLPNKPGDQRFCHIDK